MCVFGKRADLLVRTILMVAIVAMPAAVEAAQVRRCPAVEVRAMTYNIRLDVASDGLNAWPYRRNELIGQIEIIRPDILGMQEVVPGQRRDLITAFPGYQFVGVGRDDGADSGEYSPLAISRNRFAVGSSGTYWLSPTPDRPSLGWGANYKRIVTWARLTHRPTGTRILALNTHWDHESLAARSESAALMARWVAEQRRPDEHLLLLGDFNAALTEKSMTLLAGAGLRDSRTFAASVLGPEASFNAFSAMPPKAPPIDHILVTDGWTIQRHVTIAQHVDGRVPSDHFPVVADLRTKSLNCSR